jgi:putative serine/threonine protein kinase
VPLKQLWGERFGRVLCYPRYDEAELGRRVEELKKLGVKAVEFDGEKTAFDVPILGKGCVGIVVVALTGRGKVAMKVRRVDAQRNDMQREAEMLRMANVVGVGPRLLDTTENFLLMEFVEGTLLPKWVEMSEGRGTRSRIRRVLRKVLEQCWRLDELGLDHGELSRAPKHVIVSSEGKPCSASIHRKVSNVTSICQYFFIGSQAAKTIKKKLGEINREDLIKALRTYKQQRIRENFEKILKLCNLQNV